MPTNVDVLQDLIGSGDLLTMPDIGDAVTVYESLLYSDDGRAIVSLNADQRIITGVLSVLSSGGTSTVYLSNASTNATLDLQGTVRNSNKGSGQDVSALYVGGAGAHVTIGERGFIGTLGSSAAGILLASDSTTTTAEIVNNGEIYGENPIIRIGAENVSIVNNGLITAPGFDTDPEFDYQSYSDGYGGVDTIVNNGTIVGSIWFNSGDDTYDGRLGELNGVIHAGSGHDVLYGGMEQNIFHGDAGNDSMHGGGGVDWLYGDDGNDTLQGGDGDDQLSGGLGEDLLKGDAGNDSLYSGGGNDRLYGGIGKDLIVAGDGDDRLFGDAGNDRLFGDDGNDVLYGGEGDDQLSGRNGTDILKGDAGNDVLRGGNDNDSLYGGEGDDTLYGGMGDSSSNNTGNDRLSGDAGNDALNGEDGNDSLYGGTGNDGLNGGAGADKLYGGAGADSFIFKNITESTMTTRDMIYDFSQSQGDKINLYAIDVNPANGGNQAFVFIGEKAFSNKAGELRYINTNGDTYVYGDVNGDGKTDFSVHLDKTIALVKGDFIL